MLLDQKPKRGIVAAFDDFGADFGATVCCAACQSALSPAPARNDDVTRLECTSCGQEWPVRFGIPDLRPQDIEDPYLTRNEDLRAADQLAQRAVSGGFEAALAAYYETNERVSPTQARRFIAGTLAAEDRARAVLGRWIAWSGRLKAGQTFLEPGCGTGPLLVAAQASNAHIVGVDVGLRWLVLAAARLRDRNASALLVCAGAERLPLRDASVDVVASESLLENVSSAEGAVAEAARVLRPGGWFWVTTANRWSIGPDPHVGLPMGGWMPDRVVGAWAMRNGMVPPRRHLLGSGNLRRLVSPPLFERTRLGPPPVSEAQRQGASPLIRAAVDAYRVTARTAIGRAALVAIGPSLIAVAQRTDARQSPARGA
jgi:SAM-dependent methyltransferase